MKLSEILYEEVKDIWDGYLTHPFVAGIGDGSLPLEKFRFYMIQDYLYLYDYCKVFALGIVKAQDPELMRFFADFVHSTLNGEMTIHRSYLSRLDYDIAGIEQEEKSLTNLSYTHYMLAIGQNEGLLELLVSILSCAVSYEHIGKHLASIPGAAEHPFYGEWIRGYASKEYADGNVRLNEMVDRLGEGISPEQTARLKEIYRNCSRYEKLFWDMAYHMSLD
jgi:thiaminase/transcriptional activator TenA